MTMGRMMVVTKGAEMDFQNHRDHMNQGNDISLPLSHTDPESVFLLPIHIFSKGLCMPLTLF